MDLGYNQEEAAEERHPGMPVLLELCSGVVVGAALESY